ISAKKEEDKSEGKQLKGVPIIQDFPNVFPKDFLGLPPAQPVEFHIDLIPGVAPVARAPYRLAPSGPSRAVTRTCNEEIRQLFYTRTLARWPYGRSHGGHQILFPMLLLFYTCALARWPYGRSHGGHQISLPMLLAMEKPDTTEKESKVAIWSQPWRASDTTFDVAGLSLFIKPSERERYLIVIHTVSAATTQLMGKPHTTEFNY
nr:reverse transcriptase domain-containing protein [Tanacetum cinerariifolium]